jgi:hypothetical protein
MKNPSSASKESKSERVIVHVRMRPFSEDELKKDNTTPVETFDTANKTIVGKFNIFLLIVKKEGDKKTFNFDNLFPTNITQKEIFDKAAKNVVDVKILYFIKYFIVSFERLQRNDFCIWPNRNRKDFYYGWRFFR